MTTDLATIPDTRPLAIQCDPKEMMSTAQNVASVCKAVVTATACTIQGKKYVPVEGWQTIANAHGCVLSSKNVERIEGGVRAIGEVRRADSGELIATAEGFVGDDEGVWAKRPEYAKRAMAQTRAMSRAGRSAFAYIVVLMKAGLEVTPKEEIEGLDLKPAQTVQEPRRASEKPKEAPPADDLSNAPKDDLSLDDGALSIVTAIEKISTKTGTSARGDWKRYGLLAATDKNWYSTFSESDGAMVVKACKENKGALFEIIYTDNGKGGRDIQKITLES